MRGRVLGRLVIVAAAAIALAKQRPLYHENAFKESDALELRVFLSDSPRFSDFNNSEALLWHEEKLVYHEKLAALEHTVEVPITDAMLANNTVYAHMFVTKAGASPDPRHGSYDRWATTSTVQELIGFDKRNEPIGLHNLITGEPAPWEAELRRGAAAAVADGRPDGEHISYWKPKLHAQLLIDTVAYPLGAMPPLMQHFLQGHRLISGHRYRPLIYVRARAERRMPTPARACASHPHLPLPSRVCVCR